VDGCSAVDSEAKARAEGKITFKRRTDATRVVEGAGAAEVPARKKTKKAAGAVGERAGAVKKPSMLSFDDEQDDT
jgi:hypothetical protein